MIKGIANLGEIAGKALKEFNLLCFAREASYLVDYGEFDAFDLEKKFDSFVYDLCKEYALSPEELKSELIQRTSSKWVYFTFQGLI
jgi:hypothetical protein